MHRKVNQPTTTKETTAMSANKMKYWEVNTTVIVKALNKSDAELAARNTRRRIANAQVLTSFASVDRIPASSAHEMVAETV
jgi:hypothetical protein